MVAIQLKSISQHFHDIQDRFKWVIWCARNGRRGPCHKEVVQERKVGNKIEEEGYLRLRYSSNIGKNAAMSFASEAFISGSELDMDGPATASASTKVSGLEVFSLRPRSASTTQGFELRSHLVQQTILRFSGVRRELKRATDG